jgi:hypothetical protein
MNAPHATAKIENAYLPELKLFKRLIIFIPNPPTGDFCSFAGTKKPIPV